MGQQETGELKQHLNPGEHILVGKWSVVDGTMQRDEVCLRIEYLVSDVLQKISVESWEALYRDPVDGRFWELTWPQSHLHGGGPPQLQHLTDELARRKYLAIE